MLHWDKKLVGQMEKKRHHYFFGIAILSMILTSLFLAVPTQSSTDLTRPISMEEEQGVIVALDHLGETLPTQSLTLQNWMNKITDGSVEILVSDSKEANIHVDNGTLVVSSHFFQEDPITQQKELSDALGMRFDYSKAAEIAFSKE